MFYNKSSCCPTVFQPVKVAVLFLLCDMWRKYPYPGFCKVFPPSQFHGCSRVFSNRPHFPWVYRRDNPRRITSRRRAIYKLYECSPNITHIHQPMVRLPRACRGRTALRFPANSSDMCRVQLAHKRVLCTRLGSRGSLRHGFSPFMLMNPNKRQTAIHGCFFL